MVDQEHVAVIEKLLSAVSTQDVNSFLCSSDRDFLICNTNNQVKVDSLKGKKIGLYFSASWCGPCHQFTPKLAEVYNELLPKGDFEIVFVSADNDDEAFNEYFSKMPWLAIPFSDYETRDHLDKSYNVKGIPHFVILDENAKLLTDRGVEMICNYGVEGYPFTPERVEEIKVQEEAARTEQSLKSILVSPSRDYVIAAGGKKIPVSELEGKTIGLYFFYSIFNDCIAFIPKLVEVYNKLKEKGENFEIVTIPIDDEEEAFKEGFESMPWFSLPVTDKSCKTLARHFELWMLPTLVIIGPNGKTLHGNVAEAIEEHGVEAYPFTPEKFAELHEIEKAKREAQTLESILVAGHRNFVIGEDGVRIPVIDLVGKNILLYFSAHWCAPCRAFLPKLIEAYHKIKANDDAFEVIFISSDSDQASSDEFFSTMPWLALPFGDERKGTLTSLFKVRSIPMLVAIGPTGKTVTTEAKNLITYHGSDAYPFTEDRLTEIEAQYEEMAKGWPEKIKHALHEKHELVLTKSQNYTCDGCHEGGSFRSFSCEECNFDLHPKCALEDKRVTEDDADVEAEIQKPKDGWVCNGDVCYRP